MRSVSINMINNLNGFLQLVKRIEMTIRFSTLHVYHFLFSTQLDLRLSLFQVSSCHESG